MKTKNIKENIKNFLQKLEKKKVITKYPKPIYPFLLAFLSLIILLITYQTNKEFEHSELETLLINYLIVLTIFAFVFAILHLIVVRILENH